MHDLIIENARIVDGTGGPERHGAVAVDDGRITEVGEVHGHATRRIDAAGRLLTPGFVDIHTHYDGQFCWDKMVTPSSWHGVTTVVAGNCGVGFAPVRPGTENELIELMESVEDIPGTALHEGIPWGWESFAEYLDAIDTPYVLDVGTQVPHVAVRHYVMGERCHDPATAADMAEMAAITTAGLRAGGMGFSTSRFFGHRDKHGNLVPGTRAAAEEMLAIGDAFATAATGTMEIISDSLDDPEELAWIERIVRHSRRPVTVLVTPGVHPDLWSLAARLRSEGLQLRPQVGARPASVLMTLEGTLNPMRLFPTYAEIADLPVAEQRRRLRDPDFRARVVADEAKTTRYAEANRMLSQWDAIYVLPADLSYEPDYADSIAGRAEARGCHGREELMDVMADGRPLLFLFGNYPGDLEGQRQAIADELSVFGLSDGGAHCGVLCDAGVPTYLLAYMARDRTKGPLLPVELVVHKLTQDAALVYGLRDRGVIAPGYKADLNLIDFDRLALTDPRMTYDLPAGGKRIVQGATGYAATICDGRVTHEDGEPTGEMPGRLLRGPTAAVGA